jgi:dihydroneopterin triphosphate diphosphatase
MKRPESVLVVILNWQCQFLLLQKKNKLLFWQSVTGSLEEGETFEAAASRELYEETGLTLQQGFLLNTHRKIPYQLYDWNRSRYAHGIEIGIEQVFYFFIPEKLMVTLSDEHHQYRWAPLKEALPYFLSATNRKEAVKAAQSLRQLRRGALCRSKY